MKNYSRNTESKLEENVFSWLIYKYVPYWPLFAALVVIGLLLAWAYLKYTTPVFEASATLIIKDEKKGVDDSQIVESMNPFSSNKIVENEIEVIQSRKLMKQVVKDLVLYAPVFEAVQPRGHSAYHTSPVTMELKEPDKIKTSQKKQAEINFEYDNLKNEIKIKGKSYPLNKWVKVPEYGEIRFFLNSNQINDAQHPLYFKLIHPKLVTNYLLENLKIRAADKLSTVVNLTLVDEVPQRGEDILNHLIKSYNQEAISHRNILANNTLAFVEDRMVSVEKELEELELEIQKYRSNKGVIDLSEQGKLYLQDVGDNDRMISDIALQLEVLDNVENYVISKGNSGGIVPSTLGIQDPILTQLLEKLYNSELEYEKLRKTTAENNPILVSVSNEIKKIRPGILENIQNQRANLQSRMKNLNYTNRGYNSTLRSIPEKERALLEISRRKAIKNELFSFLLQKREETALSYAPSEGDSRIVDMAESSIEPINPKPKFIYGLSLFLALGAGIGFVNLKEFSNKIMFSHELETFTNFPVIIELPHQKSSGNQKQKLLIKRFIEERFRDLRVALGLYGRVENKRKILITSSIEGEGKSFVSENLALVLATAGYKVLLINFDLRKPNSALFADFNGEKGMADYLLEKMDLDQIIHTSIYKNLSVIPAGTPSKEAEGCIVDAELASLFENLENMFDYVIVDTPPLSTALDACVLNKYCDTTLFTVRHGYTPKSMVKHFDQNKSISYLNNLFIVFNGIKRRGIYERGYGYGYGLR